MNIISINENLETEDFQKYMTALQKQIDDYPAFRTILLLAVIKSMLVNLVV